MQRGDTLWSVARQAGVSVAELLHLNARTGETIRVGEVLRVPDDAGTPVVRAVPGGSAAPGVRDVPALPVAADGPVQVGQAVYYGGRADPRTAMTAAHLQLPFGTWVRVTHLRTGRSVDVMINDRGPFGVAARIIDLSTVAATALGIRSEGVAPVTVRVLSRP